MLGLAVDRWAVHEQVENIEAPRLVVAVNIRPRKTQRLELSEPSVGPRFENRDVSEGNGARGAGLRARGPESVVDPVVAKRALMRRTGLFAECDNAKRAGRDAVLAADADILLHDHVSHVRPDDRLYRAGVQAACVVAVLAGIAGEEPVCFGPVLVEFLDKADMPPVGRGEISGIVIGVSAEVERDRIGYPGEFAKV